MATVDIDTLKRDHPSEFQREYEKWVQTYFHYDWWDGVRDIFVEDMAEFGVEIAQEWRNGSSAGHRIYFSLSYSQSDYAAFDANVHMCTWAKAMKLDEQYPALVVDLEEYGATARISSYRRGSYSCVASYDYAPGNTSPAGIFSGLASEAWDTLVEEQFAACAIEKLMDEWVKAQCQKLYRQLQEEYEYLSSEDQFVEWAKSMDEQFEVEDEICCEV